MVAMEFTEIQPLKMFALRNLCCFTVNAPTLEVADCSECAMNDNVKTFYVMVNTV